MKAQSLPHEADDAASVFRRKIYLAALVVGVFASLANVYFNASLSKPDSYQRLILPIVALSCFAMFVLLWRYPLSQRFVELGMTLIVSAAVLSRLYYGLYDKHVVFARDAELSVLAAWFPIVYILNYLILRRGEAWWASALNYLAVCVISAPHMITNLRSGTGMDELFITLQVLTAHPIYIILLLVFSRLKEDYVQVSAHASRMTDLALTDALTGLPNRRQFADDLERELARAERQKVPTALIMFDVDHFKQINDSYGHAVGDQVLNEMSKRIRMTLRGADVLARWGGDEFLILALETDAQQARRLAEKLRALLQARPYESAGLVTASFGVTEYCAGDAAADLLKRADSALYSAKADGRNRVEVG